MMEDHEFRTFFQQLMDRYILDPDTAKALLQRILKILSQHTSEDNQP